MIYGCGASVGEVSLEPDRSTETAWYQVYVISLVYGFPILLIRFASNDLTFPVSDPEQLAQIFPKTAKVALCLSKRFSPEEVRSLILTFGALFFWMSLLGFYLGVSLVLVGSWVARKQGKATPKLNASRNLTDLSEKFYLSLLALSAMFWVCWRAAFVWAPFYSAWREAYGKFLSGIYWFCVWAVIFLLIPGTALGALILTARVKAKLWRARQPPLPLGANGGHSRTFTS